MWGRRLVVLLVLALLSVVSMGFAPRGTAPFSVVYGPASAFRAERAFLLLSFAVLAVLKLAAVLIRLTVSRRSSEWPAVGSSGSVLDSAPLISTLRC